MSIVLVREGVDDKIVNVLSYVLVGLGCVLYFVLYIVECLLNFWLVFGVLVEIERDLCIF